MVTVFLVTISSVMLCARDAGGEKGGSAGGRPTAADVERSIQSKGAKLTLAELTRDQAQWDRITDEMAKGGEEWLKVLRDLYKDADGGAALDLGIAASEALATSPKTVFEILEPSMGLDFLCDNDASVGTKMKEALQFIDARRVAVKKLHDDKLAPKRDKCLALLDELEKATRASQERGDIE